MKKTFHNEGSTIIAEAGALFQGSPRKEWITILVDQEASSAARILSAKQELRRLSPGSGPEGRARYILDLLDANEADVSVGTFVNPNRDSLLKMLRQLDMTLNDEVLVKRPKFVSESEDIGTAVNAMLEAVSTFLVEK